MNTVELFFKISELIISTIGILLIIIGFIIPYKQSINLNKFNQQEQIEQEKRAWRMQLLNEQISKYYGPISEILTEQAIIRTRIWYQIGRQTIFDNGKDKLSDLSDDEQLIWMNFIDDYKMPLQRQIIEIMKDNAHLAIHDEKYLYVNKFLDYVLSWELLDNQKRNGVPNNYEYYYSYNYPVGFDNYIEENLKELIKQKSILLEESEVSI